MDITEFVITNCKNQNATTPEDYIGMTRACLSTVLEFGVMTPDSVIHIARLINNDENLHYRRQPAVFANGNMALAAAHIPRQLEMLLANARNFTAEQFYVEFEKIHPFRDGNGRLGAILYSWHLDNYWLIPPEPENWPSVH